MTVDRDGVVRAQDNGFDVGAYEFIPSVSLKGTPADRAIHLSWTANATLPATSTWQIDYYNWTDHPSPITHVSSTTRAYTLTDLTNHARYTVTLNAVLEGTPFLTDTVTVMPTEHVVYLPLTLKSY